MATTPEYGKVSLELDRIDTRPASQMRANVKSEIVDEYAEDFDRLPPMKVIVDARDVHWLVDGSYRYRAAVKLEKGSVRCLVKRGTYEEAYAEACRSNDAHGVRVTNEDKRHRVREALKDKEMSKLSSRTLADRCGVSDSLVLSVRPSMKSEVKESYTSTNNVQDSCTSSVDDAPDEVVGKDGKSYPASRGGDRKAPEKVVMKGPPLPTDEVGTIRIVDGEEKKLAANNKWYRTTRKPKDAEVGSNVESGSIPDVGGNGEHDDDDEPESPPDDGPEEEPDWDALWEADAMTIREMFDSRPDDDERAYFAMKLSTLASTLIGRCSNIVDRSGESLE